MKPLADLAPEGRANPKGISYLYTASDKETAIAETRPWVGAYVTVSGLTVQRLLRIVNCIASDPETPLVYFEEPTATEKEASNWDAIDMAFSRPVTPSDRSADYAATQIVAEEFRRQGFDGIAYRSSVGAGRNFAIFDVSAAEVSVSHVCLVAALSLTTKNVTVAYPQNQRIGRAEEQPRPHPGQMAADELETPLVSTREITPADNDAERLVSDARAIQSGDGITEQNIKAFRMFQKAALAGNREALFCMCECYETGRGVDRDHAQGLIWMKKAAEAGHPAAQNRYGCEMLATSETDAVHWFQLAAGHGDADAQLNLAESYYEGRGIQKDYSLAVCWCWFQRAAAQGNRYAEYRLGILYHRGEGVPKNASEGVRWLRRAAEQGYRTAKYELGLCFAEGRGVSRDENEAVVWWRLAAEQNHSEAQYRLGCSYTKGRGTPRNNVQAYLWLRLAAEGSSGNLATIARDEAALLENSLGPEEIEAALQLCREWDEQDAWSNVFSELMTREWKPLARHPPTENVD